jgi:peptide-methionine (R)-S-oxide reductase
MNTFLRRTWVCLATAALLGGSISAGQESARSPRQKAGDDSPAAVEKTDGGPDATTASDPAGAGTAGKDAAEKADQKAKAKAKPEPEFVRKTDAEWRKTLTRVQYMVTRQKATEPAFSGRYATGHYRGTFLCVCCDAEVFNAHNKFDSGTGWPSFDRPANAKSMVREMDYSAGEPRVEVNCRRCGAHLGHVFDDGPTMTGLRFCINSAAIKLKPPEGESTSTKAPTPAASRRTSKARTKTKATTKSKAKAQQPSNSSPESPDSADGDSPAEKTTAPAAKPSGEPSG